MSDDYPPSRSSSLTFQKVLSLFVKNNDKETKADFREYLQEAQENEVIAREEANMIAGVLSVSELKVRDVMIPRTQMVTICHNASFDETTLKVIESGHSRFPVEKDEEIIGILLAKDLLTIKHEDKDNFDLIKIMRPVHLIPESRPLDVMLRDFRYRRVHMAIVTNEYGDIAGLLTIEDVLEEIVGEIDDEHDKKDVPQIHQLDTSSFLVSALTEVEDFNTWFNVDFDDEKADTIGGYILVQFGYVPAVGEKIEAKNLTFIVKEADDRRITALVVKVSKAKAQEVKKIRISN